jgi:hypothetical protein
MPLGKIIFSTGQIQFGHLAQKGKNEQLADLKLVEIVIMII